MRVTITGATGLLGTRIVSELRARGDEVTVLSRNPDRAEAALGVEAHGWDPATQAAPAAALSGRDGVVHLSGEGIAQRWTEDARRHIASSREVGTRNLVAGLRAAQPRPRRAGLRLGHRLLRSPRRRARHRGGPARRRLRGRGLPALGARGTRRRGAGDARRADADGGRARPPRRRAGPHAGALPPRGGRAGRRRAPIPPVDRGDRRRRHVSRRARRRWLVGAAQRHRPRAGHQPRLLKGPGPRAAPPGARSRPRGRPQAALRRHGPRSC